MRFIEAVGTAPKASRSVETFDVESTDDSLSDESSSSIPLENDSDIDLPQELLQALKIYGTPWPHSRHKDARVRSAKHHKEFSLSREEERKLEKGNKAGQREYRNSTPKELRSAPSVPGRYFSYTGPPPRPSPWKEVYLTMIKPNEQLAEKRLKTKTLKTSAKKKKANGEHISVLREQLAKKINSIKRKTSSIWRHNTPEEEELLGVAISVGKDSNGSSSTRGRPASRTSYSSCLISNDSFGELCIDRFYKGCDESAVTGAHGDMIRNVKSLDADGMNTGKTRRLFTRKHNKVSPM